MNNPKRNGKIAHLPETIQEQLNGRLYDNQPARVLIEWLNGLPEVQAVMTQYFGGRPLSEQNISEWRQGGYKEWLDQLQSGPGLIQTDPELRKRFRSALIACFEDALVAYMRRTVENALELLSKKHLEESFQQSDSSNN